MTSNHKHRHPDRRTRITTAAISGIVAGLTRAILDAMLHHLSTGC